MGEYSYVKRQGMQCRNYNGLFLSVGGAPPFFIIAAFKAT